MDKKMNYFVKIEKRIRFGLGRIRFGLGSIRFGLGKTKSYELVYTSRTFFFDVHIGQNSQISFFFSQNRSRHKPCYF